MSNSTSSSDACRFDVVLPLGTKPSSNGNLRTVVVLRVDGREVTSEVVSLGTNRSKKDTASRWANQFGINYDSLFEKLGKLALSIVARQSSREQERRTVAETCNLRITDVAADSLARLQLEWHERYTAVYSRALGRKIKVTDLWRHHANDDIDRIAATIEALRDGRLTHAQHLNLFKNATLVAAEGLISKLPDIDRSEIVDPTIDRNELVARICAQFERPRIVRDSSTSEQSIVGWAFSLEPGCSWTQFYALPVASKFEKGAHAPDIAVKPAWLARELRYESTRRLNANLRGTKLAVVQSIRIAGGPVWRAACLDQSIVESSQTQANDEVTNEIDSAD